MANKYTGEIEIDAGGSRFILFGNFRTAESFQVKGGNCFAIYEQIVKSDYDLTQIRKYLSCCLDTRDGVKATEKDAYDLLDSLGIQEAVIHVATLLSYQIGGDPAKSNLSRKAALAWFQKKKDSTRGLFSKLLRRTA